MNGNGSGCLTDECLLLNRHRMLRALLGSPRRPASPNIVFLHGNLDKTVGFPDWFLCVFLRICYSAWFIVKYIQIYKRSSSYLAGNTLRLRYKAQPVGETIAVYYENHVEHTNILWVGKKQTFIMLKQVVFIVTTVL
jgi:hypothetical protein